MSAAATEPDAPEVEIDEFTGIPKRTPRGDEQQGPAEPQPIIEISTVVEREFITIDQERYDLASWHDFGIVKRQELQQQSVEFNRLWATQELTDEQKKRLNRLLTLLFKEAIPRMPAAVAKKLDDANRESIVVAFTLAPVREAIRPAQQAQLQKEAEARESSTTAS